VSNALSSIAGPTYDGISPEHQQLLQRALRTFDDFTENTSGMVNILPKLYSAILTMRVTMPYCLLSNKYMLQAIQHCQGVSGSGRLTFSVLLDPSTYHGWR